MDWTLLKGSHQNSVTELWEQAQTLDEADGLTKVGWAQCTDQLCHKSRQKGGQKLPHFSCHQIQQTQWKGWQAMAKMDWRTHSKSKQNFCIIYYEADNFWLACNKKGEKWNQSLCLDSKYFFKREVMQQPKNLTSLLKQNTSLYFKLKQLFSSLRKSENGTK